jgi:hypothetical protein
MADDAGSKETTEAIRLYTAYRAALDASEIGGRFMPYNWWALPDPIGIIWLPYAQMLDEFATELANIINNLTHHVHRLRAWAQVVDSLSDHEKLMATHEFIDTLGTVALGMPYTIKSRFAFATASLCHQANRAKDPTGWRDEFPDARALYLNEVDPICAGWRRYRAFKLRVEPIAGNAFKAATEDFRNAYAHRFSARFVIGMTGVVSRTVGSDGTVGYGIGGGTEPLGLNSVADILTLERDQCYRAFDAFQSLVGEQVEAIAQFEAAPSA